jgi:hypothetical protein
MMEVVSGFATDVVALIWHDKISDDDIRADLTPSERDARAGKHDFRLFAKLNTFDTRSQRKPDRAGDDAGADQWSNFDRIAVVTDDALSRHAVQFFAPFFHHPVRVFSNSESWKARVWLQGRDVR